MKRIGFLALAVFAVAALAGCNDTGEDRRIAIRVILSDDCTGIIAQAAGDIESAEADWKSTELVLRPGEDLDLTLPQGGLYRYRFTSSLHVWEGYESFSVGNEMPVLLSCL